MRKMTKGILLSLVGVSLALSGCATDTGTKPTSNQAKKQAVAKSATPLNFNYPVNIEQEASNNHTIAILAPNIQAGENVQPYIDQFQSALVKQVQEILEKKGYHIIHLADAQNLTADQKMNISSILKIRGWMGILEDADMNTENPEDTKMNGTVDQSAGAVIFKFFEPKTGRTTHNFAINVGAQRAIVYFYSRQTTNSGGFAGANLEGVSELDKNHKDAVHKILDKMYGVVVKKLVHWVTNTNLEQYRNAIDKIKK
ncbi:Neuraminyllactose-binding hemagglutinin [Helicobacter sp. NHP21005]|uniref:HpaA family protein n=1 Tax=Helicobacter felistomachi TaxID=3040201 RepID=UPI002572F275|nr:HpaA family protein [Helicobacter sp. NHP21005]BEG57502.1 Neuraminyllactose-binding hemagglutinin [Helicobacter sp. NHP21005]